MRFLRLFLSSSRSGIAQIPLLILVLVSAAVIIPITYTLNRANLDTRDRACNWECTTKCGCACSDYFDARPECRQSAPSNPSTPKPPTGGGCVSTGCTYYSCTQKLNTDSCGARILAAGFCQTGYPASNPCNINTAPTTTPTNPTNPTPQPPVNGKCPTGQWAECGGCLTGKCVDSSKTCNVMIQQYCTQTTCGGNGVVLPAGQSCCSGLVLYSNGRCGPPTTACIGDGGSKPVSGGTCCDGLINCGTTCVAAGKSCPTGTTPVPTPKPTLRPVALGSTCPAGTTYCACEGGQIPPGEQCLIASNSTTGCTADAQCETKYCAPLVSGQTVRKCTTRPTPTPSPTPKPTPRPIAYGSMCPIGSGLCACEGGGTVPQGELCAKAPNATCVNDSECETKYCSLAHKCTNPPVAKSPGVKCDSVTDCLCGGTVVANGATCPTLANGVGCSASSQCASKYCDPGYKCANRPTTIAAGQTCTTSSGCLCNGAQISIGALCPKKADYSSCSSGTECISGVCTSGLCRPKPTGNVCTNPSGCVYYRFR